MPALAGLDELDLVRVQAAHGRDGELTASDTQRVGAGYGSRLRALLSEGDAADGLYGNSIAHLGGTRVCAELAQGHLLYGEWLRHERRRADAREQLRTAHGMLDTIGIEAFAERARRDWQPPARPRASAAPRPAPT